MTKLPSLASEAKKFDKMSRPTSSAFKFANAVRPNDARAFKPSAQVKAMEATIGLHLAEHIASMKRITNQSRPANSAPKKGR